MTVYFMVYGTQAYAEAKCIEKEFKKSIRFLDSDGRTFTIKKDDIITIEKDEDVQESAYEMIEVKSNLFVIKNKQTGEFFDGYDFMGSVDWNPSQISCYWMSYDEAYQTLADLKAGE